MDSLEQTGSVVSLYTTHQRALLKYANSLVSDRSEAEDIVQEAWLRFARIVTDVWPADPLRYLYRIVRNLAIDYRRQKAREGVVLESSLPETAASTITDGEAPLDQAMRDRDAVEAVRAVVAEMPEQMRIAFEMHRFGGSKLREIAAFLNISVSMAHVLVSEAVERCRRHVDWP
ncbi:RNA polymerase sigma factor [Gluconacetobacter sp. Hr-1-5]|uniref:RNA polymerase sigma factor n=1 Tax=Gluconacetobacter sp. Hr-1-5 TaxID=3395370 RepID=UPI003B51FBEC